MKKAFLLVLNIVSLSAFSTHLSSAQSIQFGENVNFGLKAGFNWTSINDEKRVEDSGVTPRPGFHVGGLAHFHLSDNWAIQPELMYSKEGAKYESAKYTGKTDLNSVNLPILVQYMIGPGFRIETGPQFGLFTGTKFENADNDEKRKTDIQNGNVSWAFGLGYLTNSGFGIDVRYNMGLSNIYPKDVYPGQHARTRAGQLGFFYQFK
ncbi:porin family protein [Nibribacter koreensis]|uniref:Porin family protein n=1 Tax=Nibribacter koreensis TaxID=1084519 RepID=A0ABP8F876_9BACT